MKLIFGGLLLFSTLVSAQPSQKSIDKVLDKINDLRSNGCKCGNAYMMPAQPVQWDHTLHQVSKEYARYLYRNNRFSHETKDGKTLGDRLDAIGYRWLRIGENLGKGYHDFYDVLEAWLDSPSHCKMLMDPEVTDFGMSKHYDYWVQTFTKPVEYASY